MRGAPQRPPKVSTQRRHAAPAPQKVSTARAPEIVGRSRRSSASPPAPQIVQDARRAAAVRESASEGEEGERGEKESTRAETGRKRSRSTPSPDAPPIVCTCSSLMRSSVSAAVLPRRSSPAPLPPPFSILLLGEKEELTDQKRSFPQLQTRGSVYISILPAISTSGLCTFFFTPQNYSDLPHPVPPPQKPSFHPFHNELNSSLTDLISPLGRAFGHNTFSNAQTHVFTQSFRFILSNLETYYITFLNALNPNFGSQGT